MKRYDRIRTYFFENLYIVIPMAITALTFNGLMAFLPRIEGETINSLLDNDFEETKRLVLIFIGMVLFVQCNRFFKRYLVRVFGNKISYRMRSVSIDNLMDRDISYFIETKAGDILNRNLSDIADTTEGIRKMTTEVFDTFVLLIGYFISMLLMDYKITLFASIFIVLSVLSSHFMKKFVYRSNKSYKEYLSLYKECTLVRLDNEIYYRGLGISESYFKEYEKKTMELKKRNTKAILFQSSLEPVYLSIASIGIFFILYFGGRNVIHGVYEIGILAAFISTYLLVARKAAKVGKLFNAYQAFKVSWVRTKDFLVEREKKIYSESIGDTLVLSDFSFQYTTGFQLPILHLELHPGDILAVTGGVHSGKSTFLKALSGIYGYQGSATLGDVELSRVAYNEKQLISYSSSTVSLFSDSIERNITLDREGDFDWAIQASCLYEDMERMGGKDGILSHSNPNISGGQQKRVQMARALYPKARLVLLDDPFQSVRPEMASRMIQELTKKKDQIWVIATNRPEVVEHATKVLYLDKNEGILDDYSSLLQNSSFRKLMGVEL